MASSSLTKKLGARIRRARRQAGLTQAQLADRVGVMHPQSVSRWERGLQTPELERVERIAAETKKPLSFFLGEDGLEDGREQQAEDVLERLTLQVDRLAQLLEDRLRAPDDHKANGS